METASAPPLPRRQQGSSSYNVLQERHSQQEPLGPRRQREVKELSGCMEQNLEVRHVLPVENRRRQSA